MAINHGKLDATSEDVTMSPRQRMVKLIDAAVAEGWQGEHVLQMIERQTLGFSPTEGKIAFFWSGFEKDDCEEDVV